jgi:hypothetical protein
MGDKVNRKTKTELYEMLAEAVRNTQLRPKPRVVREPDED